MADTRTRRQSKERRAERLPPGEPGDDLRSDPISLAQTGRPYLKSIRQRGRVSPSLMMIVSICAFAVLAAAVYFAFA